MGIAGDANPWWLDVLENGPASPRAASSTSTGPRSRRELRDKVLLPILGDQYGACSSRGSSRSSSTDGAFLVRYYEHALPLAPRTYAADPRPTALEPLASGWAPSDAGCRSCAASLTALEHLPGRAPSADPAQIAERRREKEIIKRRLAGARRGVGRRPRARRGDVRVVQRHAGRPAQLRPLDELLARAGLPAGLLAGGRRGDQLPPLLRHQRPGRASAWRTPGLRRDPPR